MVTFSGTVVPVTGTNNFGAGGAFEIVSFDSTANLVDSVPKSGGNIHTEFTIGAGGAFEIVSFDSTANLVDSVPKSGGNIHTEFTIFDVELDFRFSPTPTATGVSVIEFGFDINFSFDVPERINRRVFPVSVEFATLFPGDVPRGDPLN